MLDRSFFSRRSDLQLVAGTQERRTNVYLVPHKIADPRFLPHKIGRCVPIIHLFLALVEVSTQVSDFIRFRIKSVPHNHSECIRRTSYSLSTSVKDVSIDHRRLHVLVAEQFLNRADVVPLLKQMRGEGMPSRGCEVAGFIDPKHEKLISKRERRAGDTLRR